MVFPSIPQPNGDGEIRRMLSAALIDQRFCQLLLTNPSKAISQGYNGQTFHLSESEQQRLSSIQASSLTAWTQLAIDGYVANND